MMLAKALLLQHDACQYIRKSLALIRHEQYCMDRLLDQVLPFTPTCLFQNLSKDEINGNVRKKHSMTTQVCACAVSDISGFQISVQTST